VFQLAMGGFGMVMERGGLKGLDAEDALETAGTPAA
jgi:hypothetical protein